MPFEYPTNLVFLCTGWVLNGQSSTYRTTQNNIIFVNNVLATKKNICGNNVLATIFWQQCFGNNVSATIPADTQTRFRSNVFRFGNVTIAKCVLAIVCVFRVRRCHVMFIFSKIQKVWSVMVRGPGFASLRVHFLTTAAKVDLNTGRVKESVVCHLQHNKNGKTARQKR